MIERDILEKFEAIYTKLLIYSIYGRLHVKFGAEIRPSDSELNFLILVSSQIVLETTFPDEVQHARWRIIAYDAVTRIAKITSEAGWKVAAKTVLSRLGNFPAISLLQDLEPDLKDDRITPILLALESDIKEIDNTLIVNPATRYLLTDFQMRLCTALRNSAPLSVSAPTSAGKSFALSVDIVRRLSLGKPSSIVYLVPTRALIRQVMTDILRQLKVAQLEDVTVLAAPIILDKEKYNHGVVYVLTQERLMSLLYSPDGDPYITTIFVDEAQELGDNERGMMLHSAVERALERFPSVEVFFVSPLTENPGFILNEFGLASNGSFFTETVSPVSQTLITLKSVNRKPTQVQVEVLGPNGPVIVGVDQVPFEFRPPLSKRLAQTALAYTHPGESSILYANGASDAEALAEELSNALPSCDDMDAPEVNELIEFVSSHVHPKYVLIDALKKGVAFHYGNMPHIIRGRVEDLIRTKKIRFVCCTSTLLQGVNLPASNIFIQNPRRGRGQSMTSGDFWNLAGRAGRLREVFSGNVWCLTPDVWETNLLSGPRLSKVTSAFREAINDDLTYDSIITMITEPERPSESEDTRIGEQAFAKIFSEYTLNGRLLSESQYAIPQVKERLIRIDSNIQKVKEAISIPGSIFMRNSTISPWRLQALWKFFENTQEPATLIPLDPFNSAFFDNLSKLFGILDDIFFKIGNRSYIYYALLSLYWMQGKTLKEIIANRLEYYKVSPDDTISINRHIRDLLDILEGVLHYKYVKYLRAYNDVLAEYFRSIGKEELANSLPPLHLYIELGAREPILISFMSLGLSRTTAILLRRATSWPSDLERDECVNRIRRMDLREVAIPAVCKREIRDLFEPVI